MGKSKDNAETLRARRCAEMRRRDRNTERIEERMREEVEEFQSVRVKEWNSVELLELWDWSRPVRAYYGAREA